MAYFQEAALFGDLVSWSGYVPIVVGFFHSVPGWLVVPESSCCCMVIPSNWSMVKELYLFYQLRSVDHLQISDKEVEEGDNVHWAWRGNSAQHMVIGFIPIPLVEYHVSEIDRRAKCYEGEMTSMGGCKVLFQMFSQKYDLSNILVISHFPLFVRFHCSTGVTISTIRLDIGSQKCGWWRVRVWGCSPAAFLISDPFATENPHWNRKITSTWAGAVEVRWLITLWGTPFLTLVVPCWFHTQVYWLFTVSQLVKGCF